ncbi:protein-L-isoaspartate O-methyltransferase [Nautilia profundicola AmH]|uniref:Protein-L-isoaspartate O-methyltransferase n=1 Tax=Nautilia profundicola (strain ATCC BAA-1463 / DSM 18972 / AmH) TaxID=598659 RepID=B9L6Z1_NAUPA|nr:protein-L-isoaspartate(D-aspartate) O-methyltransferase [Nautilia profundicola]ACM92428.1 protein-L-isoaspartate O-methyltransferase [Nautilia profundicola AmH]
MSKILADKIADYVELGPREYKAFCEIDRKYFVPAGFERKAYDITPLPLADDSTISSPLTIAKMTSYLELDDVDSVLEIGCGSGYQAAILSKIVRRVFTIDRICRLVEVAKERFKKLGLYNINVKCDDGRFGWRAYAPFDRILLSAYIEDMEKELLSQVKDDGFILAPVKVGNEQVITRFYKDGRKEMLEACEFVPVKKGVVK